MEFKQTVTVLPTVLPAQFRRSQEVRYFKAPVYLKGIQKGRDALPRMLEKLGNPPEWRYTLHVRWYSSPRVVNGEIQKSWSLVETHGHDSIVRH